MAIMKRARLKRMISGWQSSTLKIVQGVAKPTKIFGSVSLHDPSLMIAVSFLTIGPYAPSPVSRL